MQSRLTVALKEWAVVQRALLEGRQILLLRKGGIVEETGDFDLQARQFLLQPTYAHETERAGDVQAAFASRLAEVERERPEAGILRIEAACEVVDIVRLSHPDGVLALSEQHIWSEQFVRSRFEWEPYKPVFAVLVRTVRLPEPAIVPMHPDYAGCRSWSTLHKPISVERAAAAIASESRFDALLSDARRTLAGS